MKKISAIMLIIMTIFTCAACGNKSECEFCKEMKVCTTANFMAQTINLCEECMVEFNALKDLYTFE